MCFAGTYVLVITPRRRSVLLRFMNSVVRVPRHSDEIAVFEVFLLTAPDSKCVRGADSIRQSGCHWKTLKIVRISVQNDRIAQFY